MDMELFFYLLLGVLPFQMTGWLVYLGLRSHQPKWAQRNILILPSLLFVLASLVFAHYFWNVPSQAGAFGNQILAMMILFLALPVGTLVNAVIGLASYFLVKLTTKVSQA